MEDIRSGVVLLVGEGDFSFTRSFVTRLRSLGISIHPDNQLRVVSTCFHTISSEYYSLVPDLHTDDMKSSEMRAEFEKKRKCFLPNALENIEAIREAGVIVIDGVDATMLHEDQRVREYQPYDHIIFNFPHIDGKSNMRENRRLIREFMISSSELVSGESGLVYMTLCAGQGGTSILPSHDDGHATHCHRHIDHSDVAGTADSWQLVTQATHSSLILTRLLGFDADIYENYNSTGFRNQGRSFKTEGGITHILCKAREIPSPQRLSLHLTSRGLPSCEGDARRVCEAGDLNELWERDVREEWGRDVREEWARDVSDVECRSLPPAYMSQLPSPPGSQDVQPPLYISRYMGDIINRKLLSSEQSHNHPLYQLTQLIVSSVSEVIGAARLQHSPDITPSLVLPRSPAATGDQPCSPLYELVDGELRRSRHHLLTPCLSRNGALTCSGEVPPAEPCYVTSEVFRHIPLPSPNDKGYIETCILGFQLLCVVNSAAESSVEWEHTLSRVIKRVTETIPLLRRYNMDIVLSPNYDTDGDNEHIKHKLHLTHAAGDERKEIGRVFNATSVISSRAGSLSYGVVFDVDIILLSIMRCDDIRVLYSDITRFDITSSQPFCHISLDAPVYRHDISFWHDGIFDEASFHATVVNAIYCMGSCESDSLVRDIKIVSIWGKIPSRRISVCYRIIYSSLEGALSKEKCAAYNTELRRVLLQLGYQLR